MSRGPAIGIDLGTTNSCVGVFQNGKVEIIPNEQGNYTTPSCVAFTDTGRLIGDPAKDQMSRNPSNTIFSAKRFFGHHPDDRTVISDMQHWPFEIINQNGRPNIRVQYKGEIKELLAEEISAMVLTKIKVFAELYLGKPVTDVVITVPAYFNDSQRQATKDAGTITGLNVLRVISEPTAAAIAYGISKRIIKEVNVVVVDFGGGYFSVSILTLEHGIFEVKSTSGDTHLGGEDFDNRMVDFLKDEFKQKTKKDMSSNKRSMCRLKAACERAKTTLSSASEARIEIDSLFEGIDFYTKISQHKFEELCEDLFRRTLEPIEKALCDSKLDKGDIQEVVLVGGSTRIPMIQNLLSDFFNGKELNRSINPDEAVAYGAAIQAAILAGDKSEEVQDLLLLDVTPLSLGIETTGGAMYQIVKKNSHLPLKYSMVFKVASDSMQLSSSDDEALALESRKEIAVPVHVYEGDRALAKDNNLLEKFNLITRPPFPKGVVKVEITFDIDRNNILNVCATDKRTDQSKRVTVMNDEGRLSEEEIERMIRNSEVYDAEDKALAAAEEKLEQYALCLKALVSEIEQSNKSAMAKCTEMTECLNIDEYAMEDLEDRHKALNELFSPIVSKLHQLNEMNKYSGQTENRTANAEPNSQNSGTEMEYRATIEELEKKLQDSELKVKNLSTLLDQAESNARDSVNRLTSAVNRLALAETHSEDLSTRLTQSEAHATDLATRLAQSEERARNLERTLAQESQPSWVIARNEIQITEQEIGRGGWGTIKVAEFRGQRVAAKMLHDEIISPNNIRLFTREMTMSARVHHPHIVQFIGATREGVPVILLELMGTNLRQQLGLAALPQNQVLSIASDISRALNYLHLTQPRPIIHRDVSTANVLLNPSTPPNMWTAKLSDFGSTNFVISMATAGPGNPVYAAPEAFNPYAQTPKMDVFSFGVVLLEACTREMPSVDIRTELIASIRWVSVVSLIQRCINMSQEARPTMDNVLAELTQLQGTATRTI